MGEAQTVPGAMRGFDAVEMACEAGCGRDRRLYGWRTAEQGFDAEIFDAQKRLNL